MTSSNACRFFTIAAFFALLVTTQSSFSQTTKPVAFITGSIADSITGDAIAYATVTLMDTVMKPVSAVAADMAGRFSLPVKAAGDFKLVVTYVGYTSHVGDIRVAEDRRTIDAGIVRLVEGEEIEGISVVVQKPLIRIAPDKLIYSVEADPERSYSTLSEILRKVPQLSLDAEEKVLLNGQNNYKVLVDGKSSSMIAKNFDEVIKSLPANSIRDIEVITEPSTKYEADGVGGIINIITNNSRITGYSGRVGAGISTLGGWDASAYLSAQLGKFNVSLNYWSGIYPFPEDRNRIEYLNYNDPDSYRQVSTSRGNSRNSNNSIWGEASYEIDTFNLISVSAEVYIGGYNSQFLSEGRVFDLPGNLKKHYRDEIKNINKYNYIGGGLDYQRTFLKPDKTFTVSYRMESNSQKTDRFDDITDILNYPARNERSYNRAGGSEHTLQVDYFDPLTKMHQIEAGLKYILRLNDSDIDEEKLENGQWVVNPDRLGGLDYTQHVLGVYGGYMFTHKKITAKAGLRLEGAWNRGTASADGENIKFDNSNVNLVPYANFTYMLKPSQRVRVSYTQRLGRPGIYQLNPYGEKNEYVEFLFSHGNPNLKTVIAHRFSAAYSIFASSWNLEVSATAAISNNDIRSYTSQVPGTDHFSSTYLNIGRVRNYFLNASFGYRLNTALNIYANAYGSYATIAAPTLGLENSGFSGNINAGGSVKLWKDALLNMNVGVYFPGVDIQTTNSAQMWNSFGLTQKLWKQKIDLGLSISNPFQKMQKYTTTLDHPGLFHGTGVSEYNARRITFRAGLRFGNMEASVKKAKRTISNDDKMESSGGGK